MARPRAFDVDLALDAAMQMFRQRGYSDTSMRDLLGGMGIGQSSFYETFGSKRQLYLQTLERFRAGTERGPLGRLETDENVLDAIRGLFGTWIDGASGKQKGASGKQKGASGKQKNVCFFGSASMENGGADREVADLCRAGFDEVRGRLERALERARASGELPGNRSPASLSSFLTASLYGLQVLGQSGVERAVLEEAAETALAALPLLRESGKLSSRPRRRT